MSSALPFPPPSLPSFPSAGFRASKSAPPLEAPPPPPPSVSSVAAPEISGVAPPLVGPVAAPVTPNTALGRFNNRPLSEAPLAAAEADTALGSPLSAISPSSGNGRLALVGEVCPGTGNGTGIGCVCERVAFTAKNVHQHERNAT